MNTTLPDFHCRFCDADSKGRAVFLPDAMYGTSELYEYVECTNCYSLQIAKIPSNMKAYYPTNYRPHLHRSYWYEMVLRIIDYLILDCPGKLAPLLSIFGLEENALRALKSRGYSKDCRVLEIGCGSARVLKALQRRGFLNITAADPFVSQANSCKLPFKILRKDISEVQGSYDLIIANHVLEHLPNPMEFFASIKRLMSPNGELLLLLPVANSKAWQLFREHWIQADAPRHLNIPSTTSLKILAHRYDLTIKKHYFNGTEFQIVGSQQRMEGISLMSRSSIYSGGIANRLILFLARIRLWRQIHSLNREGTADQAVFYLGHKAL